MRFKNQGNPTCISLILMNTPNLRLCKMVLFNFHMFVVTYSLTECGFCVLPEIRPLLLNFFLIEQHKLQSRRQNYETFQEFSLIRFTTGKVVHGIQYKSIAREQLLELPNDLGFGILANKKLWKNLKNRFSLVPSLPLRNKSLAQVVKSYIKRDIKVSFPVQFCLIS